jgi:hypothetical protein
MDCGRNPGKTYVSHSRRCLRRIGIRKSCQLFHLLKKRRKMPCFKAPKTPQERYLDTVIVLCAERCSRVFRHHRRRRRCGGRSLEGSARHLVWPEID